MVIADFLDAIKKGKHVVLEDPINGSKFLDYSKRLMNTYIVHTSVDEEESESRKLKLDISKVRRMSLTKSENGMDTIAFDDKIFINFNKEQQIVVLKKINIISDDITDIITKKYNIKSTDRISTMNIYECGVINMQNITPNVAANKYPYLYSATQFIDDKYVTEVSILYNSDTIIPRLCCSDVDNVYIKSLLQCTSYITKVIDNQNAAYLFNGEYLRTKDSVVKLVDIDAGMFVFRNVVTGEELLVDSALAGSIIIGSKAMSNKFICLEMDKDNEYLFYYKYADDKHKKEYNKEKLLEIYTDILKDHNVDDAPICIMHEDIDAIYGSISEVEKLLEEDDSDTEVIDEDMIDVVDDEDDDEE